MQYFALDLTLAGGGGWGWGWSFPPPVRPPRPAGRRLALEYGAPFSESPVATTAQIALLAVATGPPRLAQLHVRATEVAAYFSNLPMM